MKPTPLEVAISQIGVRESGGRNCGPQVDEYLRRVSLDASKGGVKGYAWCAAFVSWCVSEAYQRDFYLRGLSGPAVMPIRMTAWVWDLLKIKSRLCPARTGSVFVMSHTDKIAEMPFHAHTGFVERIDGDNVHTVEGNTNDLGSREGDGVYRRVRKMGTLFKFVDVETH